MPPVTRQRLRRLSAASSSEESEASDGSDAPPQPPPVERSGKRRRRSVATTAVQTASDDSERQWMCPACTLLNAQAAQRCKLCGHKRTSAQPPHNRSADDTQAEEEREEEEEEGEEEAREEEEERREERKERLPAPTPPLPLLARRSLRASLRAAGQYGDSAEGDSDTASHDGSSEWCTAYRPESLSDLAVHSRKVADVRRWLEHNTASAHIPATATAASMRLPQQSVLLLSGPPGSGKCFARGTRLRLFDSHTVAVEDVQGGERLMGEDGLPRTVTRGSLTRGCGALYRVIPAWSGATPFTVNGAHILVLVNYQRPHARQIGDGLWQASAWRLTADNRMELERLSAPCTRSQAEASAATVAAGWAPIEWEVSVHSFLDHSAAVRRCCQLTACAAVSFVNPQLPSLAHTLALLLGVSPSVAQRDYMAWWLGVWLPGGVSDRAAVSLCTADSPRLPLRRRHQRLVARLCLEYERLFGGHVVLSLHCSPTAARSEWRVDYGVGSVASRVLRAYGLLGHKRVPRALLCDSEEVRQCVLAGSIDGHGICHAGRSAFVRAAHRPTLDGLKELAASLGLRNSAVHCHANISQRRAVQQLLPYHILLSGEMSGVVRHCVATGSQCSPVHTVDLCDASDGSRCYGLSISRLPAGDYFGFAVHGGNNRRFLLDDFTVTHNVTRTAHTPHGSLLTPCSAQHCTDCTSPVSSGLIAQPRLLSLYTPLRGCSVEYGHISANSSEYSTGWTPTRRNRDTRAHIERRRGARSLCSCALHRVCRARCASSRAACLCPCRAGQRRVAASGSPPPLRTRVSSHSAHLPCTRSVVSVRRSQPPARSVRCVLCVRAVWRELRSDGWMGSFRSFLLRAGKYAPLVGQRRRLILLQGQPRRQTHAVPAWLSGGQLQ